MRWTFALTLMALLGVSVAEPNGASANHATPKKLQPQERTPIEGGKVLKGEELLAEMKKVCKEYDNPEAPAVIVLKLPTQQNKTKNVPCTDVEKEGTDRFFGWIPAILTWVLTASAGAA